LFKKTRSSAVAVIADRRPTAYTTYRTYYVRYYLRSA